MRGDPCGEISQPEEDRLHARIAELEQSLRARDEFLSIAAHELRNPMHSLLLQVSAAVQFARQHRDQTVVMILVCANSSSRIRA